MDERPADPLPIGAFAADAAPCDVRIRVPGSKSLSNRFLILAALARGRCRLRGLLRSDDTDRLATALATLGVFVTYECDDSGDETIALVDGAAGRLPRGGAVHLGDGGTPTRFLLALATLAAGDVTVDGSARMRERPVDEGIELLRRLGADIDATDVGTPGTVVVERLPVTVRNATGRSRIQGGRLEVGEVASSQFLSALLLVAPALPRGVELAYLSPPTSASYIDLTVQALRAVGVRTDVTNGDDGRLLGHRVEPQAIEAFDRSIEADASSAAYPALLAALVPGARVTLVGLSRSSAQPDIRFLAALEAMGARVEGANDEIVVTGPPALRAGDHDCAMFPDAAMALAIACSRAQGTSRLTGLKTLRVKETDRIAALATELTRVGCNVEAGPESLAITPPPAPRVDPVSIATYRDHRMAMSFAVLGRVRPNLSIEDPGCVAKSWPGFWRAFAALR